MKYYQLTFEVHQHDIKVKMDARSWDFIVVGAGASGCAVASSLAKSPGKPSVLVLEAGGNVDVEFRDTEKYPLPETVDSLNWLFETEPMATANNRKIRQDRGFGVGGSTVAMNVLLSDRMCLKSTDVDDPLSLCKLLEIGAGFSLTNSSTGLMSSRC